MAGRYILPLLLFAALAGLAALAPADEKKDAPTFSADQLAFYEKQVKPILQQNCYKCHTGKKRQGGLKLDSRASLIEGGDTGPAIDLKKPAGSLILKAINHKDGLEMPPSGKLPQAD